MRYPVRYAVYEGRPRVDKKAKKITEFGNLDDALNRMAIERNHGKDAYVVEIPQQI